MPKNRRNDANFQTPQITRFDFFKRLFSGGQTCSMRSSSVLQNLEVFCPFWGQF